jgi:MscS family membrane protein
MGTPHGVPIFIAAKREQLTKDRKRGFVWGMQPLFDLLHLNASNAWLRSALESGFVIILTAIVLGFGHDIINRVFRGAISLFHTPADTAFVAALTKIFRRLVILAALNFVFESMPLENRIINGLNNVIFVLIAMYLMIGLFEIINVSGAFVRTRAPEFEALLNRIAKIFIAMVVLMITMRHFNYDIWHLLTALGVGTLAVGLAAQPTLTNMIAGFTILIDRPFRPGDRIALSSGEVGDVIQIGMRSTRIYTTDGNMLIVSNGELVNTRVINFSLPNQGFGQKIKFNVDHSVAPVEIKKFVKDAVSHIEGISKDSVSVFATNMTDWGLEMGVFYKVEHYALTANVADKIIDTLVLEFRKREIKFSTMPMPVIKF